MNSAMFFPVFSNDMPSNSQLSGQTFPTGKNEMVQSFQSIMQQMTAETNSLKHESEFQPFRFPEEVGIEARESLLNLLQQINLSSNVEDEGALIQSLIDELERLLNLPEHEWIEHVQVINETLIDEEIFITNDNWLEQVIPLILEQMSQAIDSNKMNDHLLNRQGNVVAKLITYYLTEGNSTNQTLNEQMIENMNQLRQVLNGESSVKMEQFFEKLERHLTLIQNDSRGNINLQQTVQKLVNETFTHKQDSLKPINPLSLRNYQLHPTIHFGNTMTPVEQYTIFVNQSTNNASSSQQKIIEQLQQIIQSSRFGKVGGANQLTIQLKPAHLGDMVLRFVQEDNQLMVRMLVSTKAAKEMLEANLHQLRHIFSPGQVVIERQSAEQMQQQLNEYTDEQKDQQESNHQEQPNKQKQNKNEEQSLSFQDYLFHEEV